MQSMFRFMKVVSDTSLSGDHESLASPELSAQVMLDLLPDMVCALDLEGRIITTNTVFKSSFSFQDATFASDDLFLTTYLTKASMVAFRVILEQLRRTPYIAVNCLELDFLKESHRPGTKDEVFPALMWAVRTNPGKNVVVLTARHVAQPPITTISPTPAAPVPHQRKLSLRSGSAKMLKDQSQALSKEGLIRYFSMQSVLESKRDFIRYFVYPLFHCIPF